MQIKMHSDGSFASSIGDTMYCIDAINFRTKRTTFSMFYILDHKGDSYLFNIFPTNTNSSFHDEWMTFEYLSTG